MLKYGAVKVLLLLAVSALQARPYLKIQQVRAADYPYVKAEVSVSRITPITHLDRADFTVYENGWQIPVFQVKSIEPVNDPKYIVLLIDASRSLSVEEFNLQLEAARDFAARLNKNDKIAILSFHDTVMRHCSFTGDKIEIANCFNRIRRNGNNTVLYDAIYEGISMSEDLKNVRSALIVFTDGKDEGSAVSLRDLRADASENTLPVFLAATGDRREIKPVARLSHLSGGETYHTEDMADLKKIYHLLNRLLDSTYLIQYSSRKSTLPNGKDEVELEVRIKAPDKDGKGEFTDSDTYVFTLPDGAFIAWLKSLWSDERYILFIAGLFLLLVLLLIILLLRRPKVNFDISNDTIKKIEETIEHSEDHYRREYKGVQASDVEPVYSEALPANKIEYQHEKIPVDYYHAYLVEKQGPHTGRRYRIQWAVVTIGRGDENSIVLNDPTVSIQHSKIERKDGKFFVFDLMSENGVYLNDRKLLRPREVHDFDELRLGRTTLIFRRASS